MKTEQEIEKQKQYIEKVKEINQGYYRLDQAGLLMRCPKCNGMSIK